MLNFEEASLLVTEKGILVVKIGSLGVISIRPEGYVVTRTETGKRCVGRLLEQDGQFTFQGSEAPAEGCCCPACGNQLFCLSCEPPWDKPKLRLV